MNSKISSKKPVTEWETSSGGVVVLDEDDEEVNTVVCESSELLDEPDVPQVLTDDGCCFLLTDEDIQLVSAAFPKETARFQEEQVGLVASIAMIIFENMHDTYWTILIQDLLF